jgi:sugar phosphate isomerase/epimerase
MMRVGLDAFTIRELGLSPRATLDYAEQHGLDGVQFCGIRDLSPDLDSRVLSDLRAHGDALGLYTQVSVTSPNPHLFNRGSESLVSWLSREIEAAACCGWHELHGVLGGTEQRVDVQVPWSRHMADSLAVIRELGPVLRHHGSRLNLENHGDITTHELVRLVESLGAEIAGICLDTANTLVMGEDPVAAARRVAPYVRLTHCKDGILFFSDRGITRQGRPPGQGVVDWSAILPILAEHHPDLPLSIEDHKWLFEVAIFDSSWYASHPDIAPRELGQFVQLAWMCQHRINSGQMPRPADYESIPFLEQLEERLASGRHYLRAAIAAMTSPV